MRTWLTASVLLAAICVREDPVNCQRILSGTTAVVVDVIVRDNRGGPVIDLRKDDFELFEDGVRQDIGEFTVISGATPSTASVATARATQSEARAPSFTAIVFNRLSPEARGRAYQGALACLETLQQGDFVGVFVTDRSLMTIRPYTNDRASVWKALDEAARRAAWSSPQGQNLLAEPGAAAPPGTAPAAPGSPEVTAATIQQRTEDAWSTLDALQQGYSTTDALQAIATGLSVLPGRKSVVFFSEGIPRTNRPSATSSRRPL